MQRLRSAHYRSVRPSKLQKPPERQLLPLMTLTQIDDTDAKQSSCQHRHGFVSVVSDCSWSFVVVLFASSLQAQRVDWPTYGSDAGATKYSAATKITRENVSQLTPAWEWATGETPMRDKGVRPGQFQ